MAPQGATETGSGLGPELEEVKRDLRASVRRKLAQITEQQREGWSSALCARVAKLPSLWTGRPVMVFAGLETEPDLSPLVIGLRAREIPVAVPRVDWAASGMVPALVEDLDVSLVSGEHGLRVPPASAEAVDPSELGAILVPALAYDEGMARLGRGGGFYDRFLALERVTAEPIGIAFEMQVVGRVPTASHDRAVSTVVTEQRVIEPERPDDA
ncbi:MAG: 5-formyltetrahydrofolate cyclo-ligase [Planctomycetota bacterium]